MRRFLLLLVAGLLAIPVFPGARPAAASEGQQAPAEAAPASSAPSATAPGSEAPAMEQRRGYRPTVRRGHPSARPYRGRSYRGRSYRTYGSPYPSYRPYYAPYYRTYHYHYTPPIVYTSPTVVVQPAPPPVVYEQPQVVYEQQPVAYASPTPVVYEAPEEQAPSGGDSFGASFTVYFLGINESDANLSIQTIQGATLLGAGGALRFDIDTNWMLEAGLGLLGHENQDGVKQLTLPISLSAIAHLFPGSILDPYGVAGLDVIFTEYDDPAYAQVEDYTQFAGHLGFGAEINLGDFLISADLRFLFMNARPERDPSLLDFGADQPGGVSVRGDSTSASATTTANGSPDSMQTALQFQIGAGWRF